MRKHVFKLALWTLCAAVAVMTCVDYAHAFEPATSAIATILNNRDDALILRLAPVAGQDVKLCLASAQSGARDEFDDGEKDKVNVGRAVGLSFLLPGAGQWYAGRRGRAGVFLGVEAATWTAFGYFLTVKSQKRDDYQLYARVHADVDPSGKSDDFYRTLSFYDSREQYNDEGRLLDASRPYYPDTPEWDWLWESPAARQHYRSLRNQSNEAESRAKFTLGIALLNRLVSAVDAWRTARAINREARMETVQWKVRVKGQPSFENPSVAIVFSRPLF